MTSLNGYVFTVDGVVVHPQRIIDTFQRLQEEFLETNPHLRRLRFYDVRHVAISRWLRSGMEMWKASRYAGHAKPEFTARVYAKVLEADHREDGALFG